jgi:6-pyruvoyltetrahydropterin/6-carboxytetrahydropterin synthase
MNLSLTRRYRFAASHRLNTSQFSEAENRRVYGKCNSPHGHGHNYALEVIGPFDHKYLNEEIAEFQSLVPTTENVCREIFRRLEKFPAARLERVRIEETSKNSFEIARN